jgi:hypothetical protein
VGCGNWEGGEESYPSSMAEGQEASGGWLLSVKIQSCGGRKIDDVDTTRAAVLNQLCYIKKNR